MPQSLKELHISDYVSFTTVVNICSQIFDILLCFSDTSALQEHLIQQYKEATNCVQVMPLNDTEGLPLQKIYGSVLIEEDLKAVKRTQRLNEPSGRKPLDNFKDIFYVNDKLAKRIIVCGDAGHGKTVFCLKMIESWSKAKMSCRGKNEPVDPTGMGKHIQEDEGSEIGNDNSLESKTDNLLQKCMSNGKRNVHDKESMPKFSIPSDSSLSIHDERSSLVGIDEGKELQSCLSKFDLVFYIPLRHGKHGTSSIVDLVCESVPECDEEMERKIRQLLRDKSTPCLVILDGLDEWRAPDTCRNRGFPDNDGLVNCSVLCTMRPWRMVNLQLGLDSSRDKVVQILGLKGESIAKVISNILVNFYGLISTSPTYEQKLKTFCKNAKLQGLENIPLMLAASCLVWYEEDEECSSSSETYQGTSDFMTLLYVKLLKIMISRAAKKHDVITSCKKQQTQSTLKNKPQILSKFRDLIIFIEVLIPVGRLALQDLMSEEMHLVFDKDEIEDDIGEWKVDLALKAGVLSQAKAPGKSYQERVSVSFFHKSFQEFMAALYMVCGESEALVSFHTHCNTIDKVMELSNMIMFVCGLDPVVGCQLSKLVKDVVNNNADFIQYREVGYEDYKGDSDVKEMYKMQCKWFREVKQNMSYTHNTDRTPTLHATDVYLYRGAHGDVSVASELVSMEDNSIASVHLYPDYVGHPVHSIIQHLPGCKHLTSMDIIEITRTQDRELLAEVLPQLVQLKRVEYAMFYDREECADTAVVRAVQHLPALKRIELTKISLTDTVTLPTLLENVQLTDVGPAHLIVPSLYQCSQLTCLDLSGMTLNDTVTLPPQLQKLTLGHVQPVHFILPSLPGCPNLTSLNISTMKGCEVLASVLPQLPQLQFIHYNGLGSHCGHDGALTHCGSDGHAAVVSALQHLTQLRHIDLWRIDMDDACTLLVTPHMTQLQKVTLEDITMSERRWTEFFFSLQHATRLTHIGLVFINLGDNATLLVTPHMSQLQEVKLTKVEMSGRRWTEFVESLLKVQHKVTVILEETNIDGDTVDTISNSPHFTVTKNDIYNNLEIQTVQ